jgi:hypothetical protein
MVMWCISASTSKGDSVRKASIEAKQAELAAVTASLAELAEKRDGEEGYLGALDKIAEAEVNAQLKKVGVSTSKLPVIPEATAQAASAERPRRCSLIPKAGVLDPHVSLCPRGSHQPQAQLEAQLEVHNGASGEEQRRAQDRPLDEALEHQDRQDDARHDGEDKADCQPGSWLR